jgi:Major Facilitator Superfamily
MEGFRTSLERAIRMEGEIDWSVHTFDYVMFKRRLRVFAKRRARLRALIQASPDQRIPQNIVDSILGPIAYQAPALAFLGMKAEEAKMREEEARANMLNSISNNPIGRSNSSTSGVNMIDPPAEQGDYIQFVDSSVSSMSGPRLTHAVASHPVVHQTMQQTTDVHTVTEDEVLPQTLSDDHPHELLQADSSLPHTKLLVPFRSERIKRIKKRAIWRSVSNAERNELVLFLTWEMDKVAMFYHARWQRISQLIVADGMSISLGDEILELIAFCTINIVTVRQSLIRYDAFARTFEGTPLLDYYMKRVSKRQTSFRKVLHQEELNALADLFVEEMAGEPAIWTDFEAQRRMFSDIMDRTQRSEAVASTGRELVTDSFVHTLRHYFLLGGIEDALGLQPEFLTLRGQSLTGEMTKLAEWRKQKHASAEPPEQDLKPGLQRRELFQLALTLVATFLYCLNYYIVEPSSTMYCNALGAHDAMSGCLIGMTPFAAFLSAIPYSMWSNRTFRSPIILSGCLLILGNLLYASAYNFRSIHVALAGRFLTGLGAPKVLVRRYMADTTPIHLRTGVNAGFGMVVALGSALGPATAIFLNNLHFKRHIPFVGTMFFNGLTGPGYFMAALWICFTLVAVVTFREPNRQGLAEQKMLEEKSTRLASVGLDQQGAQFVAHDEPIIAIPEGDNEKLDNDYAEYELRTIFSDESRATFGEELLRHELETKRNKRWYSEALDYFDLITLPVRLCLGLLLAKVFTIEILASATSALTKNRYHWQVHQVGALGCVNGLLVIPISVLVGRLSMSHQDRTLMTWLVAIGCFGFFINIDLTDLVSTPTHTYNQGHVLAVSPQRYVLGYFLTYSPIQCFEGIIGSALSKVIPTALASGTLNSGLLATLVDTFGRACGDMFISLVGFIKLRQLMNLLFIPGFLIMLTCLVVIRRCYDVLAV